MYVYGEMTHVTAIFWWESGGKYDRGSDMDLLYGDLIDPFFPVAPEEGNETKEKREDEEKLEVSETSKLYIACLNNLRP